MAKAKPHTEKKPVEPHAKCGAKLKTKDGTCTKRAGWRTEHSGQGKCYLHGGRTPIKSGRYSSITRPRFKEKIAKFEADPDPLNLAPEVALLRAFVEDLVERWDEIYGPDGALLAWYESFTAKVTQDGQIISAAPKPRQLPDFSAVSSVVDKVGSMVDRIQKQKSEGTVKLSDLQRYIRQLGLEVMQAINHVGIDGDTSTKLISAIEDRWESVRLEAEPISNRRAA